MDAAYHCYDFSKNNSLTLTIIACHSLINVINRLISLNCTSTLFVKTNLTPNRHSSPKHYPRGTNSPKIHQEYRPNINDLKQFFDDSKRMNVKSKNYSDARTSHLPQDDLLFEGKNRSEFERVKQKFDSRHSTKSFNMSSSSKNSSRKSDRHVASQRIARSSEMSFDDGCKNDMNIHENAQFGEASANKPGYQNQIQAQLSQEKQENTVDLACSFNLDGFKVSEDDDDDVSSFCMTNVQTYINKINRKLQTLLAQIAILLRLCFHFRLHKYEPDGDYDSQMPQTVL